MATDDRPDDVPDSEYFAAFRKRLLDPVECVEHCERVADEALAHVHELSELEHELELEGCADTLEGMWEQARTHLALACQRREDARRRLAVWREHVTDSPSTTSAATRAAPPVMRARPRERRPRRHVARATSSADSGDPDPEPERCALCDVPGRLIVLARIPGNPPSTVVLCTVCWGGPTSITHWGPR